jgi:integrase
MATIKKRGDRYQARVRRTGYPEQSDTFRTKAAAERWARDIEQQMDRGAFFAPAVDTRRMTLADAVDRYRAEVSAKKRGAPQEGRRLDMWRDHELAQRPLAKILPAEITAHTERRIAAGRSPHTVRLELALLSHVYTTARKRWQLTGLVNPVAESAKPSAAPSRTRRLHLGEEGRLLWACRKVGPPWLAHIVVLAIETGMRRGEIASLTADRIRGAVAHLPTTKNGTSRDVPLSPRAQAALRRAVRAHRRHKLPLAHEITQRFTAAREAAGLEGLRFHDLRREATSRLFARGWGIPDVAAVTGHKTWSMLAVYTRPRVEDLAERLAEKKTRQA